MFLLVRKFKVVHTQILLHRWVPVTKILTLFHTEFNFICGADFSFTRILIQFLRSSWETSLFKGQHGEHRAINVSWSTVMHELFCNCVLVRDLFSFPYKNRLTLHSERKCLVYQAAAGTLMRGVKGGLAKGFTNNSLVFQKSQNKIIVIIDL